VLKDFHMSIEAPEIIRQLRDLSETLRHTKKTIVILSPVLKIPPELDKAVTIIDLPLPTYEELRRLLDERILGSGGTRRFEVSLTGDERTALVKAAQGLTMTEAENAFARAIVSDRSLDGSDIHAIIEEKRQVIRKSEVLEYYDVAEASRASAGWTC